MTNFSFQDISTEILSDKNTAAGLVYMPKYKTLAASLHTKKRLNMDEVALPKGWQDLTIPDHLRVTADGDQFLVMEERLPGKQEIVLGFSSESGIQAMKAASNLFGDGTFQIAAATNFAQCWVVVCPVDSISVPVAFYLLPSKELVAYQAMFNNLKSLLGEDYSPEKIHLDFEAATIRACKETFPDINVIGCHVHWKRCLRCKVILLKILIIK